MKEEVHAPSCGRENDLIAFLYGELEPRERAVFRSHMQECSSCGAELREFTEIRESVVAWRNEALAGVTSPAVQASAPVRDDMAKPSALAALREFFTLSPLWMKGAVVFASLLFCLFAVLAAARLREPATPPVVGRTYSERELNAVVEQRVQDELQRINKSSEPVPADRVTVKETSDRVAPRKGSNRVGQVASTSPEQKARRPLSKVERQQLAADLRLIADPVEGELDLLEDQINQ